MSVEKIQVPDLGDSAEVEVIEVLVSIGDEVSENDSLLVLESDKAAMEIPAPMSGVVTDILVKIGDQVSQGVDIVVLEASATSEKSELSEPVKLTTELEEPKLEASSEAVSTPQTAEVSVQAVKVPDLGDDSDVEIIEILVAVGDEIQEEDGLITVETDKAAMDVPSAVAGKVVSIKVKVGDKVSEGSVILEVEGVASVVTQPSSVVESEAPKPASTETKAEYVAPTVASTNNGTIAYAGPAVRKLARELGVDLHLVTGTGVKSRIVKEDVHEFVKASLKSTVAPSNSTSSIGLPTVADIDFSKFGEISEVEMSKMHRVTAQNMTRNWLTVPHVTQFEEADITDLESFRSQQKKLSEKKGIKLSPLPFIIKACAQALAEYPQFNVSLHSSGTKLIQKNYIHIGVAVATPAGLMVPVIKNADQKSVWELAAELAELSVKAKERKLSRAEMEGGCFTISSLGNLGGTGFTPIVNAPEVAIMGVSNASIKPVYIDGEFVPRKILPYSLSYDHRAVNGLDGGLFCTYLTGLLSDIRLMVL